MTQPAPGAGLADLTGRARPGAKCPHDAVGAGLEHDRREGPQRREQVQRAERARAGDERRISRGAGQQQHQRRRQVDDDQVDEREPAAARASHVGVSPILVGQAGEGAPPVIGEAQAPGADQAQDQELPRDTGGRADRVAGPRGGDGDRRDAPVGVEDAGVAAKDPDQPQQAGRGEACDQGAGPQGRVGELAPQQGGERRGRHVGEEHGQAVAARHRARGLARRAPPGKRCGGQHRRGAIQRDR